MNTIGFTLIAALGLSPMPGKVFAETSAKKSSECQVKLDLLGKEVWSLSVTPSQIKGDGTTLTWDQDVIYGFVRGQPLRLRAINDQLSGSIADSSAELYVDQLGDSLSIKGLVGLEHFEASVTPEGVFLGNQLLSVRLKPRDSGLIDTWASQVLSDERDQIRLVLTGCSLKDRPELLVVIQHLLLPRVAGFEDVLRAEK
jgi:hypothetical protein